MCLSQLLSFSYTPSISKFTLVSRLIAVLLIVKICTVIIGNNRCYLSEPLQRILEVLYEDKIIMNLLQRRKEQRTNCGEIRINKRISCIFSILDFPRKRRS